MDNRVRRWGYSAAGFLLAVSFFIAPNWISPGLGCFLAFLVGVGVFAWELLHGDHRELYRRHLASVAAFQEGYWMVCETEARAAMAVARRLRTKQAEAMLASGVMLGSALVAMRRWTEASDVLESVTKTVPESASAKQATGLASLHKLRAEALFELQRNEEAVTAVRQCIEQAERGDGVAAMLGHEAKARLCQQAGDYKGMLAHFRAIEEKLGEQTQRPSMRAIWSNQAAILLDTFHPERALLLLERALATDGCPPEERAQLLTLKGYALDQLSRPEEAIAAHREALNIHQRQLPPGDWQLAYPMLLLGQSCALAGYAEAAAVELAAAEQLESAMTNGERRELWQLRGAVALAEGQPARAESMFREALRTLDTQRIPQHPDQAPIL
ncbi:MAG: hypothetical protein JNL62_19110, partial [Bryobacterales bacterium]|nr:hypothetical protein [Bryobacterales bacterium]